MDNIKYRLKYRISRSTTLGREVISERIINRLKIEKYAITNLSEKYIEFNNSDDGLIKFSFQDVGKLQEGKFNLDNVSANEICLIYFIPYVDIIIISTAIILWSVFTSAPAMVYLFFFIFIVITSFLTIVAKKKTAENMLNDILDGVNLV